MSGSMSKSWPHLGAPLPPSAFCHSISMPSVCSCSVAVLTRLPRKTAGAFILCQRKTLHSPYSGTDLLERKWEWSEPDAAKRRNDIETIKHFIARIPDHFQSNILGKELEMSGGMTIFWQFVP